MIGWLEDLLEVSQGTARLIVSGAVIALFVLIRIGVLAVVHRRIDDPAIWYRVRKITTYALTIAALIILATIWFEGAEITTYLALVSAGLAIALADVLKDIAGWLYIVIRRPFRIGDRIEVDGHIGDIVDLRVFRFSMLEVGNWVHADQSTGRLIHVPNLVVFTSPIANYTEAFSFIWHEIEMLVTFESDWELAERIVLEALEEHAPHHQPELAQEQLRAAMGEYQIRYSHTQPTTYLTVRDSGVEITGRFLVEARQRRAVDQAVWKSILRAIADQPTVDLAYPTVRTYLPDTIKVSDTAG